MSVYLERRRQTIISPFIKGRILDLGCGFGAFVRFNRPSPENYLGIDEHDPALEWYKSNYPEFRVKKVDLESDRINSQAPFDTIVLTALLEHLKNPDGIFSQFRGLLNPNGIVLITTPTPLGGKIHYFGAKFGFFYLEAADDHEKFYTREDLRDLLDRHGLKMVHYNKFLFGGNQFSVGQML